MLIIDLCVHVCALRVWNTWRAAASFIAILRPETSLVRTNLPSKTVEWQIQAVDK